MNSKSKVIRKLMTFIFLLISLYVSLFYIAPFVSSIFSSILNPNRQVQVSTIVTTPSLINFKSLTNLNSLNLEGAAAPNSKVDLYVNDNFYSSQSSDDKGLFIFSDVGIIKGTNIIKLQAENRNGVKSSFSQNYQVDFDDTKPEIKEINLQNNQVIKNLNQNIKIIGEVSEQSEIEINGRRVSSVLGNKFEYLLGLDEGEELIEIKIKDLAGNEQVKKYNVVYKKE